MRANENKLEIMGNIAQVFIFIFGVSAIYLVGRTDELRKWGFVAGIISQPFWYYTAFTNEQWGIFIMSIFYSYSWINGFRNNFLRKKGG